MMAELVSSNKSFGGRQLKYKHDSEVLACEMVFSLYLPANPEKKKIPLIWWLSGLTCTDDNFTQKSGFQQWAAKYNTAVVMPDTSPRGEMVADDEGYDLGKGAGFYLDATQEPWAAHYQMYTYLTQELPAVVQALVPDFSGVESIMGHSMGGHGAITIGLKNQSRFKAISAFSPILTPSASPWGIKAFTSYLGEDKSAWAQYDATELIKQDAILPMLITQGTGDNFYPGQLDGAAFLEAAAKHGEKVAYQLAEGYDHSYFFIATFLEAHFAFHDQCCTRKPLVQP